jgi:predicted unusual protein kinase regulating ubiquinone biosynthesis (AarF/ABC1/UbiB family)
MTDSAFERRRASGEESSFGGRMMRFARVGTAVGGAAARFAGARLFGSQIDNPEIAAEVKAALGGLKGPLMKVAQIMSTVPDLLPEAYSTELAELQTNAPPMGWAFVKRRMSAELGQDWQKRFAAFEHEAAAAASLGQVHRAVAHDGRQLACKLQYPDMASAVEADLQQLKIVFSIYRRYDRSVDPTEVHAELAERLREELDYRREARHMGLYAFMHANEPSVHVPEPLLDLCTDRLLTMTWLDGVPILRYVDEHLDVRNAVAINMFRAWYVPLYQCGVIHGDPHLGNYTVRPDQSINLLDFGCVRVFRSAFVRAVIDLYWALLNNDEDLAVSSYETWGFKNINRNMIEILNHWARFLYRPLMEDKVQRIQDDDGVRYGAQVAAKVHQGLKEAGGVTPPREFVLMDRAAIGLGSVFTRLKAEINWHQVFHGLIADFNEDDLRARQADALARFDLPQPT